MRVANAETGVLVGQKGASLPSLPAACAYTARTGRNCGLPGRSDTPWATPLASAQDLPLHRQAAAVYVMSLEAAAFVAGYQISPGHVSPSGALNLFGADATWKNITPRRSRQQGGRRLSDL